PQRERGSPTCSLIRTVSSVWSRPGDFVTGLDCTGGRPCVGPDLFFRPHRRGWGRAPGCPPAACQLPRPPFWDSSPHHFADGVATRNIRPPSRDHDGGYHQRLLVRVVCPSALYRAHLPFGPDHDAAAPSRWRAARSGIV